MKYRSFLYMLLCVIAPTVLGGEMTEKTKVKKRVPFRAFSTEGFILNALPTEYMATKNQRNQREKELIDKLFGEFILLCNLESPIENATNSDQGFMNVIKSYNQYDCQALNEHIQKLNKFTDYSNSQKIPHLTNKERSSIFLSGKLRLVLRSGVFSETSSQTFFSVKELDSVTVKLTESWLFPGGYRNWQVFLKSRKGGNVCATSFFLKLLRANNPSKGGIDRNKVTMISEELEQLSSLHKAVYYAALTTFPENYMLSSFPQQSDKFKSQINKIFPGLNPKFAVPLFEGKRRLMKTDKDLIELFKGHKASLNKIFTSLQSILKDDDDLKPRENNLLYENVITFLVMNHSEFWTKKEFSEVQKNATLFAKKIITKVLSQTKKLPDSK